MNTVLEVLMQSEAKAKAMNLPKTELVLDQAIYAKAVEILNNPSHEDLKKFINLRMGAFHTICIFLAVIVKRFGDAGLRDWIIEADLIGKLFYSLLFLKSYVVFCFWLRQCLFSYFPFFRGSADTDLQNLHAKVDVRF